MELTQSPRAGDFILSLANGTRSLENAILASGVIAVAGEVLGKVTATGKYKKHDPAGLDGTETAAAILHAGADASGADVAIVIVARDAEVKADGLTWPAGIAAQDKTDAIAALNAVGIFLR